MLDVLLVYSSSPTSIQAIFNNFDKDAFYLKTRVLSDSYLGINVP
jgi:hypothetical protein